MHSFTLDYNKFEYGAKKKKEKKSQQLQKSDGIVASHFTTVPRKPRLTSSRCHQMLRDLKTVALPSCCPHCEYIITQRK